MVIMPAFTESKQSDPKAVSRPVTSDKSLRPPHVGSRVHQPGGVQTNHSSKEDAPHHVLPAAHNQDDQPQCRNGNPMPLADPEMELAFAQVRNVRQEFLRLVMHSPAGGDPANRRTHTAHAR